MTFADFIHSVATGSRRRRRAMTPLGLLVFGTSLGIVVAGGLLTDHWLHLPRLLPGAPGVVIGIIILVVGGSLCVWCVGRFLRAHGTPVPFNPPNELIVSGLYAWVRNPMLTGLFGTLFGLGILLGSIGITLIWTPAYVLVHFIELKRIEEPELVRRFGESYEEYCTHVPMFIPRPRRARHRTAPPSETGK